MRVHGAAIAALIYVGGCVGASEQQIARHVVVVEGRLGQVEVRVDTPEELAPGSDRELYRYSAVNLSPHDQSVAIGVALDGLPEDCVIDNVLWSSVANDANWPSFPQLNLDEQHQELESFGLRDITGECEGTFDLVVRATLVGSGEHKMLRVPITVA